MSWNTQFGNWLTGYGLSKLATQMELRGTPVTRQAVIQWRDGDTSPRPKHALAIVELAAGQLTLDDVYKHRAQLATTS